MLTSGGNSLFIFYDVFTVNVSSVAHCLAVKTALSSITTCTSAFHKGLLCKMNDQQWMNINNQ